MEESQHLPFFVYGTLLPDQPNFPLWESDIIAMEPATLVGSRMYDMGYYPMLVTAVPSEVVQGMCITIHEAPYNAVLQRIDDLEGYDPTKPDEVGYQRQAVEIVLANGRTQPAWVYLGQPELVTDKSPVAGGDWAAYAAHNQHHLQDWWASIHTVAGLHKRQ